MTAVDSYSKIARIAVLRWPW